MPKRYDVIVTAKDGDGVRHEEIVPQEKIKQRLAKLAPECDIDWNKIFTDERCKYFRHYMPADVTTTKHSYKQNQILHRNGSTVKIYISERWHETKE